MLFFLVSLNNRLLLRNTETKKVLTWLLVPTFLLLYIAWNYLRWSLINFVFACLFVVAYQDCVRWNHWWHWRQIRWKGSVTKKEGMLYMNWATCLNICFQCSEIIAQLAQYMYVQYYKNESIKLKKKKKIPKMNESQGCSFHKMHSGRAWDCIVF